jgi:hypothetical protein
LNFTQSSNFYIYNMMYLLTKLSSRIKKFTLYLILFQIFFWCIIILILSRRSIYRAFSCSHSPFFIKSFKKKLRFFPVSCYQVYFSVWNGSSFLWSFGMYQHFGLLGVIDKILEWKSYRGLREKGKVETKVCSYWTLANFL